MSVVDTIEDLYSWFCPRDYDHFVLKRLWEHWEDKTPYGVSHLWNLVIDSSWALKESNCGYMTRNGRWFSCEFAGHGFLLRHIGVVLPYVQDEAVPEMLGWLGVSGFIQNTVQILHRPTLKQQRWLKLNGHHEKLDKFMILENWKEPADENARRLACL